VFAKQFWYFLLQKVGLAVLCPQPLELSFDDRLIGGAELALL
jgi:hypothetical protein